jgi:cyclic beta-1,2-glucan synthetase
MVDPCGALQTTVTIEPGASHEIVVLLGAEQSLDKARALISRFTTVDQAVPEVERAVGAWRTRVTTVTVKTPEITFDRIVNGWLLYQTLSCRMWGRTALYQSSGAFGFRDQLQDSLAVVYSEPHLAREQIVRAAARQFVEGDVQHWWHPRTGRGVRTRFSDDLAWLPYITDHYIAVTDDRSVLDEEVPYLAMRTLEPHEHEIYDLPQISDERGSIYDHCIRAIKKACTFGEHDLPLIGSGDWNDGFSRVGIEGKGESVWLAWFLIDVLRRFARHAETRGDTALRDTFVGWMERYRAGIEANAWDGAWYIRAFFDNGSPLGSQRSDEAKIDAIAQSWSVISSAADLDRAARAMQSLEEHLVDEEAQLIKLLAPPFDKTPNDPGYIKGYLPGVRENGAQYTHGALWAVLATAMQGRGTRAFELFQLLNPVTHSLDQASADRYHVEPYVVAADVYTAEGHVGRGGWTWYTGSASWMYRVALETLLGFTKRGDTLTLNPCIPSTWDGFSIVYRFGNTEYAVEVQNPSHVERGVTTVTVDGVATSGNTVRLADDGGRHAVVVVLG